MRTLPAALALLLLPLASPAHPNPDADPLRANAYLKIVSHTYANGQTAVSNDFTSQPSRRYQLQHSTDLVKWDDSGLGEFNPDSGTTTTKGFGFTGSARHFFRVVAVLPLPQP